ncbi:hypothetical protein MNBD_IGNAVI01-2400 [hydrothermal vent metagenome]|uniref:Response regulatory domain-containing protein n=1 Tax=hydrothermal vent metagenome TaxID=652676 RepID=A0A3B1CRD3_9ZZZZ
MKKFIKNSFSNRNNGDTKSLDLKEEFAFQDFVDYAAIGIFKMNPDAVIEYANQSLAQILDYKSRSNLIGINFKEELISDSADWEKIRAKLYKHRIAKNFIIPLKQNSGASIFVRVDIRAASNTTGELSHFEGSVTDVSEFVKSVSRIKKELQSVKEEKNSGSQMIVPTAISNKYLSETIHKLKTPLNSIVGFLTLIEQGMFNSEDELKDFSHKASVSANSLIRIIDGINQKLDGSEEKKPEKKIEAKTTPQNKKEKTIEPKVPKEKVKKEAAKHEHTQKTSDTAIGNSSKNNEKDHSNNGQKILLVEDNPISQNVEMRLLKESGYSVIAVASGEDAIEAVKSQKFSLVLMDVEMPNMDGIKATKIIRKLDSPVNQIPIIAVTAHSSMKDREKCLASGMNDYIAKPININFMKMTIDQWLKRNVES